MDQWCQWCQWDKQQQQYQGTLGVWGDAMISTEAALGMSGEYESTASRPEACTCGQELDCCSSDHCPRCGCSLHSAA